MATILSYTEKSYRSIFISDVHLGTKDCRAEYLLNFLNSVDCQNLYLVGDIVDLWSMKKGIYWKESHNEVIRAILKKSKNGTRVIYIPGNHDEAFREHIGVTFGDIEIKENCIHETADKRHFYVLHGDVFDSAVTCSKFVSLFGDHLYDFLLWCNRLVNRFRIKFGMPYWSLANYIKSRVRNALSYIERYQDAVMHAAKHKAVDGVICGHIHHADVTEKDGILYCNTGDWVESCTAITEKHNGEISLIHWTEQTAVLKIEQSYAADKLADAA